MPHKIGELSRNIKKSMGDPRKRKAWHGGVGILIFAFFVLSSLIVNRTVQALNIASGNYGYYGGTYGFNSDSASSDFIPNAPTSLSSSVTTSTITFSWTAPTTTSGDTSLDNLSGYYYQTGSSSVSSSCSSGSNNTADCTGSDTATSSTSVTLSSLECGVTRYIAVRSYDARLNLSSTALTGSATTSTCGGGASSSGGGGAGPSGPTFPTAAPAAATTGATPVATIVTPTTSVNVVKDAIALAQAIGVARNTASEVQNTAKVGSSASEFKVTLGSEVSTVASNFVTYGTVNAAVKALGSGERLAVVRDMLETLGATVAADAGKFLLVAEQISNGQKPSVRNLTKEIAQAGVARDKYWKLLTGKSSPNFKIAKEDLAWNTMLYRIRFKRDLTKERVGIVKFRAIFKRDPKSPLDWATVRAWGYALQ